MAHYEEPVAKETLYRGAILNLHKYTVALENGATVPREVVEHGGGACVVALDPAGNLLLVRQYRFSAGAELWELPAGKLEPGEDPLAAAARELEEETGHRAARLTLLTKMLPTPGYSTEVIYIYRAHGLEKTAQQLDQDEFLTVEAVPFATALQMALSGEITDAKTLAGILYTAALGEGAPL